MLFLSPRKTLALFLVLSVALFSYSAGEVSAALNYAQSEIDGDGIDNDGDGYTDSEDTECPSHYEGYGTTSTGGMGGTVYWVDCSLGDLATNLDAHAGTYADPCGLRKALEASGARVVKFVNGGTIDLTGSIVVENGNITIDGFSAPSPGVTIAYAPGGSYGITIQPAVGTFQSNYILNHLRFSLAFLVNGENFTWSSSGYPENESKIADLIIDHLTLADRRSVFKGPIENLTFSNNFTYNSGSGTRVASESDLHYRHLTKNISFHRNVWTENSVRNVNLRGLIRDFDFVNNVIHYGLNDSDGYGFCIENSPYFESVNACLINNYFVANSNFDSALIYGNDPGRDSYDNGPATVLPQGAVYTGSDMGKLWVSGNILPAENKDQYSTTPRPIAVPAWAQVTTAPTTDLYKSVSQTGAHKFRQGLDQEVLDRVLAAITPPIRVVNTEVFYNNSAFDGNDPAANAADDAAIATDKEFLQHNEMATFANYTSYSKGINGVMIDIEGLEFTPGTSDFEFKVGNDSNPGGWIGARFPISITRRAGEGLGGSDRVTIIWPDYIMVNKWLEITAKTSLGIPSNEVFYIGNAIGETGNSALDAHVTPTDEINVRNNPATQTVNPAGITNRYDFNRDRKVSPTDSIICRNNGTNSSTAMGLIETVPNSPPMVTLGSDKLITLPATTLALTGTVSDDGNLPGALIYTWSQTGGPAGVTFSDASAIDTTATFPGVGVYTLKLSADDGDLAGFDGIQVTVFSPSEGVFFEDFDDNDISDWKTDFGDMRTFEFEDEPGYELCPLEEHSRISKLVDTSSFGDAIYISFKIRHTGTSSGMGWKQGRLWLTDSSGTGFGLFFALDQTGDGRLLISETTDNGSTEIYDEETDSFDAPGNPNGTDQKAIELVYSRSNNTVECFFEGVSKGILSVDASYGDFSKAIIYLKTRYEYPSSGKLMFDDLRIAGTPLGS